MNDCKSTKTCHAMHLLDQNSKVVAQKNISKGILIVSKKKDIFTMSGFFVSFSIVSLFLDKM